MSENLLRLPQPFSAMHEVAADEIDEYDHVNNAVYLTWLDRIAWAHSH
jgi:acyl-CoA thioester hydrolase